MLDPLERPAQDEHPDGDRSGRSREPARDVGELERSRNAGKRRSRRADVRDQEGEERRETDADSVPVPDQTCETLARDDAHPRAELVEEDERSRRERQHPEQLVAVVRTEYRIRRDAGRVVVGETREQARAGDRGQCDQPARAQHAA